MSAHRSDQLRLPPQSIEAEQAVIGGLLLAPDAWTRVSDLLSPEDFYRHDHVLIFRAIQEMAESVPPQAIDVLTVHAFMESQGIDVTHGGSYLVDVTSATPSAANIRAYAEIVLDKSRLRQMIERGTAIVNDAFQPEGRDSDEILAEHVTGMVALANAGHADGGLRSLRSQLQPAFADIERRWRGDDSVVLVPPWANVAAKLPGLEETDLVILAGRPGMGKTIGGVEWGVHAAENGKNVAVFSLEMASVQLTQRLISRHTGIPMSRMKIQGALTDDEWALIGAAIRHLRDVPLAITDQPGVTMAKLRAYATRMHTKVKGGLGLIVIDYLQLMAGRTNREDRRQEEIAAISRGLKLLAKELRCPIIALSQLNRSLEARPNKRPIMSDLRESGAIEQDADVIAFLYRDDYYNPDTLAPGVTEFILGKNRNGPLGTAYLSHNLPCSSFGHYEGRPKYTAPAAEKGAKKPKRGGYDGPADEDSP